MAPPPEEPTSSQKRYPKTSFKTDAALLILILEATSDGKYYNLVPLIQEHDVGQAKGIFHLESQAKRDDLRAEARQYLEKPDNPTSSTRHFLQWMQRFRIGPMQNDNEPLTFPRCELKEILSKISSISPASSDDVTTSHREATQSSTSRMTTEAPALMAGVQKEKGSFSNLPPATSSLLDTSDAPPESQQQPPALFSGVNRPRKVSISNDMKYSLARHQKLRRPIPYPPPSYNDLGVPREQEALYNPAGLPDVPRNPTIFPVAAPEDPRLGLPFGPKGTTGEGTNLPSQDARNYPNNGLKHGNARDASRNADTNLAQREDERPDSSNNQPPRDSAGSHRRTDERQDSHPSRLERHSNSRSARRSRNRHRDDYPPSDSSDPEDSSSSSSISDHHGRHRRKHRDRHRRHRRHRSRDRRDRNRSPSRERRRSPQRPRHRLKPEEILFFDPADTKVNFFIRRYHQIANIEGEDAVLLTLPRCLKGAALEWYTMRPADTIRRLDRSLREWDEQLTRQYQMPRMQARRAAEAFKFSFSKRETMPIATWLIKKTSMLHEAGVTEENDVVRYIYDGLEPLLQTACPIDEYGLDNDVDAYSQTIKIQEPPCYRVWHDNMRLLYNTRGSTQETRNPVPTARNDAPARTPTKPSPSPLQARNANTVDRLPPNGCRYCGGPHWNNQCPRKGEFAKKVFIAEPFPEPDANSTPSPDEYEQALEDNNDHLESSAYSFPDDESKN